MRTRTFRLREALALLLLVAGALCAAPSHSAGLLKVMKTGLGSGTVTSLPAGMINCGADCDENFALSAPITITATAAAGSVFVGWQGNCAGVLPDCNLTMSGNRSVRAEFRLDPDIPALTDFTPEGIQLYLDANPTVSNAGRLVRALPAEFKRGWILMTRSESLQTGTAKFPRVLLPSANAQFTFTLGLSAHASYPGSHPNAVEFMQWDPVQKNFRFHEIVLDPIPAMGEFPARARGVSIDEPRCTRCHSTRNIPNPSATDLGTTGIPPGLVKAKNKPNWDTYDSWGGAMPFNRDRIYQGSAEAAAFRALLNPWTWNSDPSSRAIMEQLELQPPGVPANDVITRTNGGTNDGHVNFSFDTGVVTTEPAPVGTTTAAIGYNFNGTAGPTTTTVQRAGVHIVLHAVNTPTNDEGRAVQFFDLLGGADGNFNQTRIGNELANHRFATGSFPLDARPVALAINKDCMKLSEPTGGAVSLFPTALTFDQAFFNSRHGGMSSNDMITDTQQRRITLPRRKADIEKFNLDRDGDVYLIAPSIPEIDLIQQYGASTSQGTSTSLERLRQEIFRRIVDAGSGDSTVMGGFYVDREIYGDTTKKLALWRWLLEPLGVSVDKWSMSVRGRSRTFTFADVFGTYTGPITNELEASLSADPFPGLAAYDCNSLVQATNTALSALPAYQDVPRYTDVQRIFNKGCIECHGGLGYPPFAAFFPADWLNFSEEDAPLDGNRLTRSYGYATSFVTTDPATSYLYQRITDTSEACPYGLMPCGGPALAKADIETIRRWIVGSTPATSGDPHITTVNGVPYDFQSAGEFTLLKGEALEIQARQTPVQTDAPLPANAHTGLSSCPSLNTAAAIRVGPHRISYQPNLSGEPDPRGMQLRIDGRLIEKLGRRGVTLAEGGRVLPTTAPGGIQIEFPGGTDVVITPAWWSHYQVWYLNIDVRHARANQGVLGAIAPNNWLPALPNDTFFGPRPAALLSRYNQLYGKFTDAWRVSNQTTLFDYAPGTSTTTFTLNGWPAFEPKSCRLPAGWDPGVEPQKPIEAAVAKRLCSAVTNTVRRENCTQDVMVTGEAGFADAYLASEKIQLNAIPQAPVLTLPEKSKVNLGETVAFNWKLTKDKDDGKLTYMHCVWPAREKQTFRHCKELDSAAEGTTVAGLKSGPYFWKVVVDDGQGGTVESELRRFAVK